MQSNLSQPMPLMSQNLQHGLVVNPDSNGIMVQGMSRDRAMKFQRRMLQQQQVQFLLNQKMA